MHFRVFFSLSICCVALCLVFSGCLTASEEQETVQSTVSPTPTTVPTTDIPPTENPAPVTTPTPIGLSSEEINLHFMDIAFGGGNLFLQRLPLPPTMTTSRATISLNSGTEHDREVIESFAKKFNSLSQSNKLFENPKEGISGDIRIKFLPPDGLDAIDLTSEMGCLNREFICDGTTCAKIKGYDIYLNSEMVGDQRTHFILRSLLYTLGFKGDSFTYPDSIFAYPENTVTSLSFLDEKAVQVMYGLGMDTWMTVDQVKAVLFFS